MPAAYFTLESVISEPRAILNHAFSSYLVSDNYQSNVFRGNISSLPKRIQMFDGDPDALAVNVKGDLELLLNRYFDRVMVSVTFKDIDVTETNQVDLYVAVTVVSDGIQFDLVKTLSDVYGKAVAVMHRLNEEA